MIHTTIQTRGMSVQERVQALTDQRGPDECWPWRGTLDKDGYAVTTDQKRQFRVHRLVFSWAKSEPESVVDHLCHTTVCKEKPCPHRKCINPAHLAAATTEANTLRGNGPPAENARKTKCKWGHELREQSWRPGWRYCPTCQVNAQRARRARRRLAAAPVRD